MGDGLLGVEAGESAHRHAHTAGDVSCPGESEADRTSPGFLHDALVYDTAEELAAVAGPFLLEGLAAGDGAVIAAGPEATAAICETVGNDPLVLVLERHALYRSRTPTAIKTFRGLAEQATPGRRIRVVGEVDFGTTAADWHEWQRYEAVINSAFAPAPLWGLCVFDTNRLPDAVLRTARETHPHLRTGAGRAVNPAYVDPASYVTSLPVPDEPMERTPPVLAVDGITHFGELRHAVAAHLADVRAPRDLAEDFSLAVDEMASNAVRHGRAPASLRLWVTPGTLVCTVGDAGAGPTDPFAGYGPAHGEDLSAGGMGLWLARQLCDHVALRREEHGNSVRLTTHWP